MDNVDEHGEFFLNGTVYPDGTHGKYYLRKGIFNINEGWWLCTNGIDTFLQIKGKQIPLTDPKQQRGKGYAIQLCALLAASAANEVTTREFEQAVEDQNGELVDKRAMAFTARHLNKKVGEALKTEESWLKLTHNKVQVDSKFFAE